MQYIAVAENNALPVTAFSAWVGPRHYQDLEPDTLAAMLAQANEAGGLLTIDRRGVVNAYGFPVYVSGNEGIRLLFAPDGAILWGRLTAVSLMVLRAAGGNVANLEGRRHLDARARILRELLARPVKATEATVAALQARLLEVSGCAVLAEPPARQICFEEWLARQDPKPT